MAIAARTSSDCVVTLKPDETGIMLNSNGSITTENCGLHANSTDDNSIETNSGGEITIDGDADICTVGDYVGLDDSSCPHK